MKNLFSTIRSWFSPKQQYISEVALLRMEYESRIQHLECVIKRLSVMLAHEEVSVTTDENTIRDHFQNHIKRVVESELDISEMVEEAIDNRDFSSDISDALDDAISNRDWDYDLRDALDWDRVADKVVDKLDWSTIVSDNELLTRDDIDLDDVMLKSEHMSEDDLVTRDDLSDMVVGELKRDWFEQKLRDDVRNIFKDTLQAVRETEDANCRNAIDDEIVSKLDALIREQMQQKFGDQWDNWFNENTRHCVKVILGEFLQSAYEQTKNEGKSAQ